MVSSKGKSYGGNIFDSVEEFSPDISYIPAELFYAIARTDFHSGRKKATSYAHMILGVIIQKAFKPENARTPPLGYAVITEWDVGVITGLGLDLISKELESLQRQNVISKEGSRIWINPPSQWKLRKLQEGKLVEPCSQESESTVRKLSADDMERIFNLMASLE